MLEAIHKTTGKSVSAFKLSRDLEWHGKEREEFIAPDYELGNTEEQSLKGIDECKVAFVHTHKRYEGTDKEEIVKEHFRMLTEGFIENPNNESEQHKLAKQYIYDNYESIKISNFEDKTLPDIAEIDDIKLESHVGVKRADVLIKFKDWHFILGRGIAFEIQISPQKETTTIVRSFDRAAEGYSVCWLWSKDLIDFKNKVRVVPYEIALNEFKEQTTKDMDIRMNEIAEKVKRFNQEQVALVHNAANENKVYVNQIDILKKETVDEIAKLLEDNKKEIQNKNQMLIQEAIFKFTDDIKSFKEAAINSIKEINLKPIIQEVIKEYKINPDDLKHLIKSVYEKEIQTQSNNMFKQTIEIEVPKIKAQFDNFLKENLMRLEPIIGQQSKEYLNANINPIISKEIKSFVNDNRKPIHDEVTKELLTSISNSLRMQSTQMWIKDRMEIFLKDTETGEMRNIHEFTVQKQEDGLYELKRRAKDGKG